LRKYIADEYQANIACRYTGYKSKAASMAIVEALPDNRENNRTYRNAK